MRRKAKGERRMEKEEGKEKDFARECTLMVANFGGDEGMQKGRARETR